MSQTVRLTDSHAHLNWPELRDDLDAVLARAREAGVHRVLTITSRAGDHDDVLGLAADRANVWAAIGVHPHEASAWGPEHAEALRARASAPRLLAVGETGLDYHYDHSPRSVQRQAFAEQVRLARELALPLIVHSREAEEDTAAVLEEEDGAAVGGIIHCFTSSARLAERCLAMGFTISFSGIVTFPSARELQDVARTIPGDRLLVETDSPYLSPVPHRGRWPNEPARVRDTAAFLAGLRDEPLADFAAATEANFDRLFPRSLSG